MRPRSMVIVALALGLTASACSDGDDGEGASATSAASAPATSTTTAAEDGATTSSTAPVDLPTTMEEWEALWAEERAAVVERIRQGGWGRSADGKELTGPGGFRVDLSACPQGWSDTEGISDTEVKIGYPMPQSGPNAEAGNIGRAHEALFAYYNERGAFTDVNGKTRSLVVLSRDDGFDPARTIPLVDELIDSEKVFAIETMGSPSTLRTYDKLNQRCIPHLMPSSGHPALGDPVDHPWTTTSSISYTTEGVMWGVFIEQRLDSEFGGKAKLGAIVLNTDGGLAWDDALRAYLESSDRKDDIEYVTQKIEPSAVTVKDEMTTLAAEDLDVLFAMTTGTSCSQIISEAATNGMKEDVPYKFLSSACKATTPISRDKAGDDPDGWWSVGGGLKDIMISDYDDDAFIVAARKMIADAGFPLSPSNNLGFYYSWVIAQAAMIAGQLDGGLTRTNMILAMRTIDMTHPMLLSGLTVNMDGNNDAYMLEGSDLSYWDAAGQTWVQDGLVSLRGQTPLCAWDAATSRCR